MLDSAAGRAYLAFCPAAERDGLLERLARRGDRTQAGTRPEELPRILAQIGAQGYAAVTRADAPNEEVTVSVPVSWQDRLRGALSVRFMSSIVSLKSGLERFLPRLRACAARIGTLLSELKAEAQSSGAPHEAV